MWRKAVTLGMARQLLIASCRSMAFLSAVLIGSCEVSAQQSANFPGNEWAKGDPAKLGWSPERLAVAETLMRDLGSTSVMIVQHGQVVVAWGDTARRVPVASVRKNFLSALYGLAVAEGRIDLDRTLADLGIDDKPPQLTDEEKRAKVRHLLEARSGVYHEAAAEPQSMREKRPARGSHPPDTFWYYNNWDFNALGAIYRQATGEDIFAAVEQRIARPIGMQDFTAADGRYSFHRSSLHPAYAMTFTARDLARFGWLFLNKGRWAGRQVIPISWVEESTRSYSETDRRTGYGYMWWIAHGTRQFRTDFGPGSYSARGYGGELILIAPAHDMIIVHLVESYVTDRLNELLARIMEAAPPLH